MPRREPTGQEPEPEPRRIDTQKRIYLPADVREALEAQPGDYLAFRIEGREVRMFKVRWVPER